MGEKKNRASWKSPTTPITFLMVRPLPLEVALLSRHVIINDRPNSVAQTGQIYDSQDAQQYLFFRNCKCDSYHILLQYGKRPRYIFISKFKLPMMNIFRYSP